MLVRLLTAYAVWNPTATYCCHWGLFGGIFLTQNELSQGDTILNFAVGLLLLVATEEQAFWLLGKLLGDIMHDYFHPPR